MKEVRLSETDDPVNYLIDLLKKQMGILHSIQAHPKPSIEAMYNIQRNRIDEVCRDIMVAVNSLKKAVFDIGGSDGSPPKHVHMRLVRTVKQCIVTAQRCLTLFDDLSTAYRLPQTECVLFMRIGSLLE